eukprot:TRINITY_DN46978_c0_g1_i1.p1 TRINITY_DN46978_c0_g1~~TRINITY_DN46978_c0_g1_i1.p1  ORF type:complete len:521 (+),score=120.55 TRINITY_DN46978_c0_g1_i1:92-1654(+)
MAGGSVNLQVGRVGSLQAVSSHASAVVVAPAASAAAAVYQVAVPSTLSVTSTPCSEGSSLVMPKPPVAARVGSIARVQSMPVALCAAAAKPGRQFVNLKPLSTRSGSFTVAQVSTTASPTAGSTSSGGSPFGGALPGFFPVERRYSVDTAGSSPAARRVETFPALSETYINGGVVYMPMPAATFHTSPAMVQSRVSSPLLPVRTMSTTSGSTQAALTPHEEDVISPQPTITPDIASTPTQFWGRGMSDVNHLEDLQKTLWKYNHDLLCQRGLFNTLFRKSLCHFDAAECPGVEGYVALTLDDAPGILGPAATLLPEVRRLLSRFAAKATFFMMSDHVPGHEANLRGLVADGHELQNHCKADRSYFWDSAEAFQGALHESQAILDGFGRSARRWFRAPKGMMSATMQNVLDEEGYTNVMFDRYALDTEVGDAEWIAERLLDKVASGSVLLIHVPERGFREWNLEALELLLQGLQERGLKAVTVSELAARAESTTAPPPMIQGAPQQLLDRRAVRRSGKACC